MKAIHFFERLLFSKKKKTLKNHINREQLYAGAVLALHNHISAVN